jgi:GNAT superfamily N-acetyltransferase
MRDVAALASENFRVHVTFPSRGISEALVRETPALTWVDSGLEIDTFSIVLGSRLGPGEVGPALQEIVAHFERVGRPFSWWVSPGDGPGDLADRLEAGGLAPEEWEAAMACDLGRGLVPAPPVPGIVIERATTREALGEFARINAGNWNPPDVLVERYYGRASDRLLADHSPLRFYVARLDGEAVAAIEVAVAGGVLGVYNLSTRPDRRRRGIGGALLSAALGEAARVTAADHAVLQAAPTAEGLYRRLGFVEFGRIQEFKPVRSVR